MEQPPSPNRHPRRKRWLAMAAALVVVAAGAAAVVRSGDSASDPAPASKRQRPAADPAPQVEVPSDPSRGSTLNHPVVDPAKLKDCLMTTIDGVPDDAGIAGQSDKRLGHFRFVGDGDAEIVVLPSYRAAEEFTNLFPEPHPTNGGKVVHRYGNVVIRTNDGEYHAKPSKVRASRLKDCPRDPEVMRAESHVAGQFTTCTEPSGATARGLLVNGVSCKRGREIADLGRDDLNERGYGHVTMHVCCSIAAHFVSEGDASVIYQTG